MRKLNLIYLFVVSLLFLTNCQQQKSSNEDVSERKIESNTTQISDMEIQTKSESPITINSPINNAKVPQRPLVEGTVSNSDYIVWVIVHPMEVSDYWVQPIIKVRNDRTWKTNIYIGREGNIDIGKHFEIMAIANPKEKLEEGIKLSYWPESEEQSVIIDLIRK